MAISEGDNAIIAALMILRDRVTQLPLAIAQNAAQAAQYAARPTGAPREPERKGLGGQLVNVSGALAGRFAALLGPLAAFGAVLTSQTSGTQVLGKAIQLFATAIGPVVLPLVFALAVGLATASDVIFGKLLPALDDFNKWVLGSAIPAVIEFAESCGRAVEFLKMLADSPVGQALGGTGEGGIFGAINRTLDRFGNIDKTLSSVGEMERGLDDATRLVVPGGDRLVGAKNWLKRNLGVEDGSGPAGGTGSEVSSTTRAAADKARSDTLRELVLSMGPKASSGSVSSVWSRAQMAALNQSPFERRMLEMMTIVVSRMARAAEPGSSPWTALVSDAAMAAAEMAARRRGR